MTVLNRPTRLPVAERKRFLTVSTISYTLCLQCYVKS